MNGKAARSPCETNFCLRAAGFTGVSNEVARAKKNFFSGTGSLQASHGCSAHTVLKNIDPHRALPAWQIGKLAYLPLKGYAKLMINLRGLYPNEIPYCIL